MDGASCVEGSIETALARYRLHAPGLRVVISDRKFDPTSRAVLLHRNPCVPADDGGRGRRAPRGAPHQASGRHRAAGAADRARHSRPRRVSGSGAAGWPREAWPSRADRHRETRRKRRERRQPDADAGTQSSPRGRRIRYEEVAFEDATHAHSRFRRPSPSTTAPAWRETREDARPPLQAADAHAEARAPRTAGPVVNAGASAAPIVISGAANAPQYAAKYGIMMIWSAPWGSCWCSHASAS